MKRNLYPEARAKMSAAAKRQMANPTARTRLSEANRGENNPMFGRRHTTEAKARIGAHVPTPEARERMSKARREHPVSNETRAKLSKALKGRKMSDETRAKMSAATKAAWVRRKQAKGEVK